MKIMNRPRRGGKTFEMIQILALNPDRALLVTANEHMRQFTIEFANRQFPNVERKRWERQIVSAATLSNLRGRILANTEVYVDNMEMVLAVLLGQEPRIATTTSELI
jgi:hypothetical protein